MDIWAALANNYPASLLPDLRQGRHFHTRRLALQKVRSPRGAASHELRSPWGSALQEVRSPRGSLNRRFTHQEEVRSKGGSFTGGSLPRRLSPQEVRSPQDLFLRRFAHPGGSLTQEVRSPRRIARQGDLLAQEVCSPRKLARSPQGLLAKRSAQPPGSLIYEVLSSTRFAHLRGAIIFKVCSPRDSAPHEACSLRGSLPTRFQSSQGSPRGLLSTNFALHEVRSPRGLLSTRFALHEVRSQQGSCPPTAPYSSPALQLSSSSTACSSHPAATWSLNSRLFPRPLCYKAGSVVLLPCLPAKRLALHGRLACYEVRSPQVSGRHRALHE